MRTDPDKMDIRTLRFERDLHPGHQATTTNRNDHLLEHFESYRTLTGNDCRIGKWQHYRYLLVRFQLRHLIEYDLKVGESVARLRHSSG